MSLAESKIIKFKNNGFVYSYCAPKSGNEPSNVVFILHGDDTNIDRWKRRVKQIHESMIDTAVIAIQGNVEGNAKKHHDAKVAQKGEKVYRWIKRSNPIEFAASFIGDKLFGHSAARKIEKFIDIKTEELGLKSKDVAVVGSSMGGVAVASSHINKKSPYGAFVLASSGVMTARPLFYRIKKAVGKVLYFIAPQSKKHSLSKAFNLVADNREIYISMIKKDNIFDTRAREEEKKLKGRSNFISQAISNAYSSMFGREETVKRLEKNGVNVVTKIYDNVPKNDYRRHKTTDTMWFDDIKYVANKIGATFDIVAAEKVMKPWAAKKREFNARSGALVAALGISRNDAKNRLKEAEEFNNNPKNKLKSLISGY